ncbi:MAG: class I SAM-dependent methyltransferase [Steroidobacteraceae bacterium]
MSPTTEELLEIYRLKYDGKGWGPRMRLAAGYFSPDEFYESEVARHVVQGTTWADIGCGRDIFPSNRRLAEVLCARAASVVGIDPDPNVLENPFVTERFQGMIEDYPAGKRFDLVTLRMVAEHITNPDIAVGKLARLLKPSGRLIIYTTSKWAPMSIIAMLVPFGMHNTLKRLIWNSEARDTFPTAYKLNTRRDLSRHTSAHCLKEISYRIIDDCRITGGYRVLQWIELRIRKLLRAIGLRHPESCILAVYERTGTPAAAKEPLSVQRASA